MNTHVYLLVATGVLWVLFLAPSVTFILTGWRTRRKALLSSFRPRVIDLYFRQFNPSDNPVALKQNDASYSEDDEKKLKGALEKQYREYSGIKSLVMIVLGLAFLAGLMLCWTALTVEQWIGVDNKRSGLLPPVAIAAFFGGFMWVFNDHVARWPSWSFSKNQLLFCCLRLGISVPLGYSIGTFGNEHVMPAVAFLLGAFPTETLLGFGRRLVSKQFNFDTETQGQLTSLQSLPAVDSRAAEIFSQDQVSNVFDLAYADPILLSVQTNLRFIYVTECITQALLARYLGNGIEKVRNYGLCGSQEARNLWNSLKSTETAERQLAEARVAELGQVLNIGTAGLQGVLDEVACDPYTVFYAELWGMEHGHTNG